MPMLLKKKEGKVCTEKVEKGQKRPTKINGFGKRAYGETCREFNLFKLKREEVGGIVGSLCINNCRRKR